MLSLYEIGPSCRAAVHRRPDVTERGRVLFRIGCQATSLRPQQRGECPDLHMTPWIEFVVQALIAIGATC